MSSPAGIRYSQADFFARWMPSSSRAGVILSPCPDLAGSPRGRSASLEPDDSFASDFAPLPGSADSSCLGVDGSERSPGGEKVGTGGAVNGGPDGVDAMASASEDMPVMMKLEQLRKWQQHMQEQLKAHQLEELLHLQAEQQRLLGMTNGLQHGTEGWDSRETPHSPTTNYHEVTLGLRQQQKPPPAQTLEGLPGGPDCEEVDDEAEGSWSSGGEDQEHGVERTHFQEHDDTLIASNGEALTEHSSSREEDVFHDRPIRLGVCGQKKTFEELLEEQMRVEEQRLKSAWQPQTHGGAEAPPKRTYLKRGEGLLRFTANRKAPPPKMGAKNDTKPKPPSRALRRSSSEPAAIQRLAVQRKTATLNKENRPRGLCSPPRDLRGETKAAWTKVLASQQRRNTETVDGEPDRTRAEPRRPWRPKDAASTARVERSGGADAPRPNPVAKQVGASREPEEGQPAGGGDGVLGESFEVSFQEKLRRWDCDQQLETVELGEFELLEQAAEELSFSSNSSFVMKVLQLDQQHGGLHPRRLSSTPIKSPPRGAIQRCSGPTAPNCSVSSEALAAKARDDAVGDKVSVEDELRQSDASTCESEGQEVGVQPPSFPGTFHFPARSDPPYDRRSYQDEESGGDSASDGTPLDDVGPDESTLIEDGDGQRYGVVFDDDDTWNDPEDAGSGDDGGGAGPADGIAPPGRTLSSKLAVNKGAEADEGAAPPPPASQLMTRLFPSLKPKAQNAPLHPPPESKRAEETTGQQVQSRQLRERLVELEIEIERFKKENAALAKFRQENEKNREHLRTERSQFEQTKAEELAKFEEFKKEENRRLQKERKLFEKHASAARAVPDKKEREEIQALKQQLSSLQEELRGRETRWASSHSRLRQQVDSLSQENGSLRDEIRVLEKLRLSSWQKNPVDAEKDRETKEGPKTCENNASVTKGVKFASPLDSRGGGPISRRISPPHSDTAACRGGSGGGGQGAAAGMKSSLRRPSATCLPSTASLSSSWPGRKTDERLTPGSEGQDKPPDPEHLKSSSLPSEPEGGEVQEVLPNTDGKFFSLQKETLLAGGRRLIVFNNGTKKEVSADGLTVKVTFFNGDTKEVTADQRVIYFYAEAKTTHVTYPDGMEVLHFPNNQTEKHFPDGRKEIVFPDQTVKNLFPSGREESVLTDGTVIQVNPDGVKEILFNTGQKEIHTANYKRREYPDGTAKTVYADGRQETRYPNGRLRVKDRDGNVVLDNGA
uniref:centromere protein J isoform X2 n=1 Tax=Gasterosteus aculeatus aculeatus TaxID=481459 RepID=UPI001A99DD01|nr:centromere protein J isoform X2 [Gasterosteus aculeatus aculeatus]